MNCPHCGKYIKDDPALEVLARIRQDHARRIAAKTLGSIKSERKAKASAINGKLGGRPRNTKEKI